MELRAMAERDLAVTLEKDSWDVKVTDPGGHYVAMRGQSMDIAQVIDPDTGQAVSGRSATVALRLSTLKANGVAIPLGIADASSKPWVVEFLDVVGNCCTFKVARTNPDRTLGIVVCILEKYVA
jgi:hypothetical protein